MSKTSKKNQNESKNYLQDHLSMRVYKNLKDPLTSLVIKCARHPSVHDQVPDVMHQLQAVNLQLEIRSAFNNMAIVMFVWVGGLVSTCIVPTQLSSVKSGK